MSAGPVVTRFAPSPTGELHLGNARTALFSWLCARGAPGGRFLLRIEDTDAARSSAALAEGLQDDLRWLGLSWDGPVWQQSARGAVYDAALDRLRAAGTVYPCFCTPEQLAQARRAQLAAGRPPRYAGTCRALAPDTGAARVAAGEPHALRFAVAATGDLRFDDLVHGPRQFALADIGDFIVRRADGSPSFFFSNAVDDAESGVTCVLRGEDHLANTPRQLLVLAALGLPAPRYGHLALLTGADGAPLSKRSGALSLATLRARGYLPAAVTNLLFRLGHSGAPPGLLSLPAMAAAFDTRHLQRAPAQFDPQQLEGWQRDAVQALDATEAEAWLGPRLVRVPPALRGAFVAAVRANLLLPADADEWIDVVFGADPAADAEAAEAIAAADPALFDAAAGAAETAGHDFAQIAAAARAATGARGAALFKPLRAALTGRLRGPELGPLLPLLPAGAAARRLRRHTTALRG